MCRLLDELRQSIAACATGFDAAALTPAQAGDVVRLCARIEASAASIKALAAARTADGPGWQIEGYRSPAEQLARSTGMSPGAARRALETGKRMAQQPEVASAALAGDLSLEQASAVSEGVAAYPARARELVEKAKRASLPELHDEVSRIKAAHTDLEQRRREIHAKRSLRRQTGLDGAMSAHMYGHPEDGALIWRMLDPIRRRLIMCRRADNHVESLDALDYDALVAVASVATGKPGELGLGDLVDLGLFPQLVAGGRPPGHGTLPDSGPGTARAAGGNDPGAGRGNGAALVPRSAPTSQATLFAPGIEPGGSPPGADPPSQDPRRLAEGCPDQVEPMPPRGGPGTGIAGPPAVAGRRPKKLAGGPTRVMIRVDLDALLRGCPVDGEVCEIAGWGPVSVSVVEDVLASENPFIIGILTKGRAVVGVYHHGRHPNSHQRSALDFVYPTCAVEGCSSRVGLQYDHREDWERTHYTVFDLLDRLCRHHHQLKTNHGWNLVEGRGKRPFVSPDDPRHPGRAGAPPARTDPQPDPP